MTAAELQDACAAGQRLLAETDYLAAEAVLVPAVDAALALRDFDTLARLLMPLQETRRQIRQRAGEGVVCLDLIESKNAPPLEAKRIVEQFPHGQILVAGRADISPAVEARKLARERRLFLDVFLGASYTVGPATVIAIVPTADVSLPADADSIDELVRKLPPFSVVLPAGELPRGTMKGSDQTYAFTMSVFERLHRPFLAAADSAKDPMQKINGYRKTIEVDYACELAHQNWAAVARQLAKR